MDPLDSYVKRRAISGMRWSMLLNLGTIPLSLCTNMILGRASPDALGYYAAIGIFQGSFHAFLVPGGRDVFTRLLPPLRPGERVGFTLSYLALVLTWLLAVVACVTVFAPGLLSRVLDYFRIPALWIALVIAPAIIIWAFTTHFLFATLNAPRAAVTMRALPIAFFLISLLGFGPFRSWLQGDPDGYLWRGAVLAYVSVMLVGLINVFRTNEIRVEPERRWVLPKGFASVVLYTHLGTVVTFVYTSLVPSLVLFWMDVSSLARLHAALRYGVLLNALPVMSSPVLAPGVSRLEASGQRETGLRHVSTIIRAILLVVYPACIALIFFAGDAMAVFNAEFRENRDLLRIVAVSTLAGPTVHLGQGVAAALGIFRGYLAASVIYVVSALSLSAALIPTYGLHGAALAAVLAALVQQTAVSVVLRSRAGFRTPGRVYAAWICGIGASAVALWLDPNRVVAAGLFALFVGLFALLGRVTPAEIRGWARRFLRGR